VAIGNDGGAWRWLNGETGWRQPYRQSACGGGRPSWAGSQLSAALGNGGGSNRLA